MKRGKNKTIIFAVVLVLVFLSLTFASANIFSDLWGKFTGKLINAPSVSGNAVINYSQECVECPVPRDGCDYSGASCLSCGTLVCDGDGLGKVDGSSGYWTDWYNRDSPSGSGDWELLKDLGDVCSGQKIIGVQCETTSGIDSNKTGQVVSCSTTSGFSCQNSQNPSDCLDYQIRFECEKKEVKNASSCFDSDGGLDYYTKGNLKISQDRGTIRGNDSCFDAPFNVPDGTTNLDVVKMFVDAGLSVPEISQPGDYLMEMTCQSQNIKGVKNYKEAISYKCPNGCLDGACISISNSTCTVNSFTGVSSCTLNSDQEINVEVGGINEEIKITYIGHDSPRGDVVNFRINGLDYSALSEGESMNLDNGNILYVKSIIYQEYVGGTSQVNFTLSPPDSSNLSCPSLVNDIISPSSFEDNNGINYSLSSKENYSGRWDFDGNHSKYTEYSALWDFDFYRGSNYQHGYIEKDAMVFDDGVNTSEIMQSYLQNNFCQVNSFSSDKGVSSKIYVCNWNVYSRGVDIDQNSWKNREIFWPHGNVLIRFSVGFGKSLTEDQVSKLVEKETGKFLNSLSNNQGKYVGWENFNLPGPFSDQVLEGLEKCSSEIPKNVCSPSWECITEPAVCPEHGFQTQDCKDYSCGNPEIKTKISCNPGICSGCLVPKWFGENSLGDDRCIPYGFRFESQIGWKLENQTNSQYLDLKVHDANSRAYEGVNLSVFSDGLAKLYVQDWNNETYSFRKGDTVKINVSGWEEVSNLSLFVKDVYYDPKNYSNSSISFNFTYSSLGKAAENINAYCDIDGNVKPQKIKDLNGNWASCQNNYECESNVCSSGECVEVKDIAKQASSLKNLLVKVLCRVGSVFGGQAYDECVAENL